MLEEVMRRTDGFTLLEVMITVAIVAIIAAIAYPSYRSHVESSRRNEATNALMQGAQALERYYSINGSYTNDDGNVPQVYPAQVPENGPAYYTLSPVASGDNAFTLRATRAGVMAGDACGNFEINQAGAVSITSAEPGMTVDRCWRR